MSHLTIRCTCGTFEAAVHDVSPESSNRVVCYCDDCQAFARALHRGHDVLDRAGGTDVVQVSQGSLELRKGLNRLALLRLSPAGTFRWYASCCDTPIGNTHWKRGVPFIGLIHICLKVPEGATSLDDVVGPVRGSVFQQFAIGGRSAARRDGAPSWKILARAIRLILLWRLRGDHRRSPLFTADTAEPIVTPRVLSADELRAARAAVTSPST